MGSCQISRITLIALGAAIALGPPGAAQNAAPPAPPRKASPVADDPSSHQPVEPAVADRGPLAMPGRQMPYELALPQGFDRVYRVPGNTGKFYRASGALYAVFDESVYRLSKEGARTAEVPPGTVYYIGRPDWSTLRGVQDIEAGSIMLQEQIDARKGHASADDIGEAPAKSDTPAPATTQSEPPADAAAIEFASKHHDVAATTGRLPKDVDRSLLVGDGQDVAPRMVADALYRQERLSLLFQQAMSRRVGP
ncbi:MAG: hypothetical protein EXS03_03505 [Phycisphaerales bacterium]|nr:hypothetical protein [Phycisphaerales bacterium]